MPLVSQEVSNYIGGVSQQPNILRYPNQLEEQVNGLSNEVRGVEKRPPSVIVNKLEGSQKTNCKYHYIYRDNNEQYIVELSSRGIKVWDNKGNPINVNNSSGFGYLNCDNPEEDLRVVSVADYTFIVNRKKVVSMNANFTDMSHRNEHIFWVKQVNYGKGGAILVAEGDGWSEKANFLMPSGTNNNQSSMVSTTSAIMALNASFNNIDRPNVKFEALTNVKYAQMNAHGNDYLIRYSKWNPDRRDNFIMDMGQSWVALRKSDRSEFKAHAMDSMGNQSVVHIGGSVKTINDLPPSAPDYYICEVRGSTTGDQDNFYVKYDPIQAKWVECAKGGIKYQIAPSTMPHVLIRESDGSFTFKEEKWGERQVGDEDSNPLPSFVNNTINDVFFFQNRLGFVSGESIILSESGSFFNFWFNSATAIADTDPIDVSVSSNSVSTLTHAITFNQSLLLFSKEGQFIMTSDGFLSPKTVSADSLTRYTYDTYVQPLGLGNSVYFISDRAQNSSLMRFYLTDTSSEQPTAEDATAHAPNYLPKEISLITGNTSTNTVIIVPRVKSNEVYVYKTLGGESVQAQKSISKWTIAKGFSILYATTVGTDLYFVVRDANSTNILLTKISLTLDTLDVEGEPYRVYLDLKKSSTLSSNGYDDYLGMTSVSVSSLYGGALGSSLEQELIFVDEEGKIITTKKESNSSYLLEGDWRNRRIIVGIPYEFSVTLSPPAIKVSSGNTVVSEQEGRLQVRYYWINYKDSGPFDVTVKDILRNQKYTYRHTNKDMDVSDNILGSLVFKDGRYKFPVQRNANDVSITISSSLTTPLTVVSGGWEGLYVRRNQRI